MSFDFIFNRFSVLKKNMKLDLNFSKFILKPIVATSAMAICSYGLYVWFINNIVNEGITTEKVATILAILVAVIIYVVAVAILKIFTKDEIESLPMGNKIYKILQKAKIY